MLPTRHDKLLGLDHLRIIGSLSPADHHHEARSWRGTDRLTASSLAIILGRATRTWSTPVIEVNQHQNVSLWVIPQRLDVLLVERFEHIGPAPAGGITLIRV